MTYKNAYCHLFNQITRLITLLESGSTQEQINVPLCLKNILQGAEEICNAPKEQPHKAPRKSTSQL